MNVARQHSQLKQSIFHGGYLLVLASLFLTAPATHAQTAVTGVYYDPVVNTNNRTADNIEYYNEFRPVDSISTSTAGDYQFNGSLASSVVFRRNTNSSNPNNSTVFYQSASTGNGSADVYGKGDSSPTLSEVMLSNDLTQGLRNPFSNYESNSNNDYLTTNIERIDFFYSGGYTVQEGDALVFFDLENVGNYGDGFRIAAFTSTSNGTPTAYANTGTLIAPDSFGDPVATPTGTNGTYIRSTTYNADNLSSNQDIGIIDGNSGSPNSSDLYLVGILIKFTDLGLSVGQTIQGFSLMAGDVAPTNAASLVNWNNSSVYKTNTDGATWGNMDFMGFGGQISRPIPEPSTYGMMLLGAGLAFFGVRRWRDSKRSAQASSAPSSV